MSAACATASFLAIQAAAAGPSADEIGELLIVGIHGPTLDQKMEEHLVRVCPGSILLFRRNLVSNQQTLALVRKLRELHQRCSRHPLFLGVDQEGGVVSRIPFDPPLPSAWAMGQTQDPQIVEALGREVGHSLRKLGFNMNLAPVLDLGARDRKSFIGSRSFGDDAENVARMGTAYSMGLIKAQVLPVAKHYPGLGPGASDPHLVVVRRSIAQNALLKNDLSPFRVFAGLFPTAVMPSHLVYPAASSEGTPGTYSSVLLKNWLRDGMGYRGLVVSDDLQMKGAQNSKSISKNVISSLNAGVDIAMISWSSRDQLQASIAIREALKKGLISQQNFNEKVERIRKTKRIIGQAPLGFSHRQNDLLVQGSSRYTGLSTEVLKKNLARLPSLPKRVSPDRIFVWPVDSRARWQIERTLQRPVYSADSIEFRKIRKNDLILAFVRSKRSARSLLAWRKSLRNQTLVINQVEPGVLGSARFFHEWPVFMHHPMLAPEIAKRLHQRWSPTLVSNQ
jgi:beta-glucosidase-like glycosyl hydrolase